MKKIKSVFLLSVLLALITSCTQMGGGQCAKNKEAYAKINEVFAKGDAEALNGLIAENAVDHDMPPGVPSGLAGAKQMATAYHAAFPDLAFNVTTVVAEGDMVTGYGTMTGTNTGPLAFMGLPATGKSVSIPFVDVVKFKDGVAVEHWGVMDQKALAVQLGLAASDEQAARQVETTKTMLVNMDANNKEGVLSLLSADFKMYHPNYPDPLDAEGYWKHVSGMNSAFSGMKHTPIDAFTAGNKVSMYGTVEGKNTGSFNGMKPSNKDVKADWLAVTEFDDAGKIKSLRVQFNQVSFMKQIGAMK